MAERIREGRISEAVGRVPQRTTAVFYIPGLTVGWGVGDPLFDGQCPTSG